MQDLYRCSKCHEFKPPEMFSADNARTYRDGLQQWCKKCINQCSSKYRIKNKKKIVLSSKQYNAKNREKIAQRQKEYCSAEYGSIYWIRNLITGKVYIGCTSSNPTRRLIQQKSNLKHNRHSNPHLQADYIKYGELTFDFAVLVTVDHESVREAERSFIIAYDDDRYNIRC